MSASPLGQGPLKVFAVGYTKGTTSSYAGLTVKSQGGNLQMAVSQLFNTGSVFNDLAAVLVACRHAGNDNLQSGSGLFFDATVDNAINDFASAGSNGLSLLSFFTGTGSGAPSGTPAIGKGAFYIRTGGSGTGSTFYIWDGAAWNPVTGA